MTLIFTVQVRHKSRHQRQQRYLQQHAQYGPLPSRYLYPLGACLRLAQSDYFIPRTAGPRLPANPGHPTDGAQLEDQDLRCGRSDQPHRQVG